MSRWKTMSLVLILGLAIGGIVPFATSWLYDKKFASNKSYLKDSTSVSTSALGEGEYHFSLTNDVLTVLEGKPGTKGKVIITGLDVKTWPKAMLDMAPTVEFHSLDEVQSFIDTANEDFWQE
ncbi:hypothetical protein Desaci_3490 [Desulfosporosinus acidiphilus SJ4]|uniref:Uncharacterized protein n=1 Tax=Desulfosporosinus acidiphilus (strain DSM 22704 / JCM 16185 / SJ4) TaxID=646529 RepID=I4D9A4_DESAJ|nr:hypothetical protein [Desulfosporosinus acidiphilus]AFM42378.1 hypothetical protein Desaci_3490 [Desulfosporosinus acidiphilus SJ4]